MNPYLLTLSCLGQLGILCWLAPSGGGLAAGLGLTGVFAMFAFTRMRWGAHLDMYLAMTGWGGLGMLLPSLHSGVLCNHQMQWGQYAAMSAGMWVFALVPIWREARCLAAAKLEGRGAWTLMLDGIGMQAGMGMAHLPLVWLPMGDARVAWFSQASTLLGMGLGMMAVQIAVQRWSGGFAGKERYGSTI